MSEVSIVDVFERYGASLAPAFGSVGSRVAMSELLRDAPASIANAYLFERRLATGDAGLALSILLAPPGVAWLRDDGRWPDVARQYEAAHRDCGTPPLLWLEFDTDRADRSKLEPSWYLSFDHRGGGWVDLVTACATAVEGRHTRSLVEKALTYVPASVGRISVGTMRGRAGGMRLNLDSFDRTSLRVYLEAIGWTGDVGNVDTFLQAFGASPGRFCVQLDVGTTFATRIGVEVVRRASERYDDEDEIARTLRAFEREGLCTARERLELARWSSYGAIALERMLGFVFAASEPEIDAFVRTVSHVKVTFDSNGSRSAKAYFGGLRAMVGRS